MAKHFELGIDLQLLSRRVRLYTIAALVAALYFAIGRLANHNLSWVEVHLPLSAASVLFLSLAVTEVYLYGLRVQQRQDKLQESQEREMGAARQLAIQRHQGLNDISRALIDALDFSQLPREVLEKLVVFFGADLVAVWVADRNSSQFTLRGCFDLDDQERDHLDAIGRTPGALDQTDAPPGHPPADPFEAATPPALAAFCERHGLAQVVLTPIVRRGERIGVLGVFHQEAQTLSEPQATEIQTVANLIASTVQVEELYRDLLQVQKIDSIGTLASGITHDFNNVLAAILACASYVKQQTDPASPAYRYLEATEASAHRGAALTRQLLSFARREGPRLTVLDPNEVIEQTLKMLERSFGKSVLLQKQLAADLQPVEADPSYLEQVILNIAVNARDVMPNGGMFTVSTRNLRLDQADPYRPKLELPDGPYVVLGFRDIGSGMDQATLQHIFDPFFTTKGPGKGTGLGLAVVRSIIRSFQGEIRVESAPGKGSFFQVILPASDKPLPVAAPAKTGETRGGHETILLAEDEDVIREMAQLTLEGLGYKVLPASDGAAAASLYR
ncbi:hypothetical protein HQ590_07675, partial [bacterium]|nr:hypothetical protein [bacterium]